MGLSVSLKMLGDWKRSVPVALRDVLAVSMDIMGRTGEESCRHALILMAQSAGNLAQRAKKNRVILKDVRLNFSSYVETWQQGKSNPSRLYKWMYGDRTPTSQKAHGSWESARKIANAGLAKRSWMWGLSKLGAQGGRAAIPGTSRVYAITGNTVNGYIKEDRLSYIVKVMAGGWEPEVVSRAQNRIMSQAAQKMEQKFQRMAASGNIHSAGFRMVADWRDNFRKLA